MGGRYLWVTINFYQAGSVCK